MDRIESHACFGGRQEVWQHASSTLACTMRFAVYLPPQSAVQACPALYWLSAAARGQGDLQAAWDAAQAGWVRASLSPTRGPALRNDLDRLMHRAIVPERSRILAQPPETLIAEWEQFKEKWSGGEP